MFVTPMFAQALSPIFDPALEVLHVTDIEAAINFWRDKMHQKAAAQPADAAPPHAWQLPSEIRELSEVYALMAWQKQTETPVERLPKAAYDAWLAWYHTTADTPCIAICSTSQGDAECKGCGRSFAEVQLWTEMTPALKRSVWQRITQENRAWRYNRYAERVH